MFFTGLAELATKKYKSAARNLLQESFDHCECPEVKLNILHVNFNIMHVGAGMSLIREPFVFGVSIRVADFPVGLVDFLAQTCSGLNYGQAAISFSLRLTSIILLTLCVCLFVVFI